MTVANNYAPIRQLGNGVSVAFSGSWSMINAANAVVALESVTTGVRTPVTQGTGANQYQISITSSGFTVTFNTAPTSSYYVDISRSTVLSQTNSYTTSSGFQGQVEENSFDALTCMVQDAAYNASQGITIPVGESYTTVLPSAAQRANGYLSFDASGNVIVATGSGSAIPISSAMTPIVQASTVGAALTLLGNAATTQNPANNSTQLATTAYADRMGTIGVSSNLVANNLSAASASVTWTADEITVGTALGGASAKIGNFNATCNLSTTGLNGMDTGTAPVSGYVAVYAIYNPATQASGTLATNATSAVAPTVYAGGHPVSGFTESALISVVPTSAASLFVIFSQQGRAIDIAQTTAAYTATFYSNFTALSVSSIIPKNAKTVNGAMSASSSLANYDPYAAIASAANSNAIGAFQTNANVPNNNGNNQSNFSGVKITTSQTIYIGSTNGVAGTFTWIINGYTI